jgi:hypothetical protein
MEIIINAFKKYSMKNKLKLIVLAVMLGIGLLIQSCSNTEPGLADVMLEMKATTALSTINGRMAETGLVFTDIILGVTEIEFETEEENEYEDGDDYEDEDDDGEDDDEEIEFEGNYIVDLIAGTSTPDFGIADIKPGLYEEIEIEMGPILDGGLTLFIAFAYTPDGATEAIKFEFSTSAELEFEIENENGFLLDDGAINQMLVLLDLDALFAELDFSGATEDTDGIVRINSDSNATLAAEILLNLGEAVDGGEDEDNDGDIDDD